VSGAVDKWTALRAGRLAVDNAGALPTAPVFALNLHSLLLPTILSVKLHTE